MRVYHTFINDCTERYTNIERLSFLAPSGARAWSATLAEGGALALSAGEATWQRFDREYVAPDGTPTEGRFVGGVVADDGALAVTVRDCWQNYPKGFAATDEGLRVDLAPDFEPGLYDAFPFEKEGHQLYYYLLDGHYRFKQGMAKTHELLLDFGGDAGRAQIFQRPLLLTAEPEWYTGSMAFYNVAPRNEQLFAAYEQAIDRNIVAYEAACERQHDYGLMNFGDWYGERGANWGNIETIPNTPSSWSISARATSTPSSSATRRTHNRDIDTVHWAPDPRSVGLVYTIRWATSAATTPSRCPHLGIPSAGGSVTHA